MYIFLRRRSNTICVDHTRIYKCPVSAPLNRVPENQHPMVINHFVSLARSIPCDCMGYLTWAKYGRPMRNLRYPSAVRVASISRTRKTYSVHCGDGNRTWRCSFGLEMCAVAKSNVARISLASSASALHVI